jgi:hypothetical protein
MRRRRKQRKEERRRRKRDRTCVSKEARAIYMYVCVTEETKSDTAQKRAHRRKKEEEEKEKKGEVKKKEKRSSVCLKEARKREMICVLYLCVLRKGRNPKQHRKEPIEEEKKGGREEKKEGRKGRFVSLFIVHCSLNPQLLCRVFLCKQLQLTLCTSVSISSVSDCSPIGKKNALSSLSVPLPFSF